MDDTETAEHRRDRHELIQLLAMAHRRLDDRGVPSAAHLKARANERANERTT